VDAGVGQGLHHWLGNQNTLGGLDLHVVLVPGDGGLGVGLGHLALQPDLFLFG